MSLFLVSPMKMVWLAFLTSSALGKYRLVQCPFSAEWHILPVTRAALPLSRSSPGGRSSP